MGKSNSIQIMASVLISVLLYVSLSKLLNYDLFVHQLHTHPYLKAYAGIIAWAVPASECMLAVCLILPATRIYGFYGALGLFTLFTAYLALMLLTEDDLPCSCGGVISSLSWQQHLVFNGLLIAISLAGSLMEQKTKHEEHEKAERGERALWV